MYRLILYGLIVLVIYSFVLSFIGFLTFPIVSLFESLVLLTIVCYIANRIFSFLFKAQTNVESWLISALILFFILSPISSSKDILFTAFAGIIAMASKYIFSMYKKHIFNPVALSLVVINLLGSDLSIWWIGTIAFLPMITIVGLLIVRKIRRFHLFFAFLIITVLGLLIQKVSLQDMFTTWPIMFFATIMLTEPLTAPPTYNLRLIYGVLTGLLFVSKFQIGTLYSTPELALVVANIYSYIVSSKQKLELTLERIDQLTKSTFELIFKPNKPLAFQPGQYLEWTLSHDHPDSRGNRRYFTISSAPTEHDVKLAVKTVSKSSSFKEKLLSLQKGDKIIAGQLAGDFVLPKNIDEKLVFIAGGIGITPFKSMIQYVVDKKEKRDIVLLYISSTNEFAYKEIFENAKKTFQLTTYYLNERLDKTFIEKRIPDYRSRTFYLSGPNAMVTSYKQLLHSLEVSKIKVDYFPGF